MLPIYYSTCVLPDIAQITFGYNTANRLVKVQVLATAAEITYEYNGDGDRVAETVNGVRTLFTLGVASSLTNVLVETTPVKNDQGQTIIQTVSYTYGLGRRRSRAEE